MLSKLPKESDQVAIRQAIQKFNKALDGNASPTWSTISVAGAGSFGSTVTIGLNSSTNQPVGGLFEVSGGYARFQENIIVMASAVINKGLSVSSNFNALLTAHVWGGLTVDSAVACNSLNVTAGAVVASSFEASGTATLYKYVYCVSTLACGSGQTIRGWAVGSTLTATAISASGVVSGGAAIFTTISTGTGSFASIDASGGLAITSSLHVAAISATGTISGGAGILTSISAGAASFTSVNADGLALTSIVTLADTTTSGLGVIYKGANRFLHNFHHPTGGGAVPTGNNTFIGVKAGNFTMGSTAVGSWQSSWNTAFGYEALANNTTGYNNFAMGGWSLLSNTTGSSNTGIGFMCLTYNQTGSGNVACGESAGTGIIGNSFSCNSLFGNYSGCLLTTGSSNIFLGYSAGYNQTTNDNLLIIDNQDRTSAALEATNALIYGLFAAAPANQDLTINANMFLSQIKAGATQAAAGAAANEFWKTSGHATLPDNVLMIGV